MIFRLQNYEKLKEGQRGFAMCNCGNARMCCAFHRKLRARARIHRSLCKLLSPVTPCRGLCDPHALAHAKPSVTVTALIRSHKCFALLNLYRQFFSVHAHDRNFQRLTNFYPLVRICCHPLPKYILHYFLYSSTKHLHIYQFTHLHICTFAKHGVTDESRMYKLW